MKISEFLSENFHFLEVKFSIYLNRRVFVVNAHTATGYVTCLVHCIFMCGKCKIIPLIIVK